MSKTYGYIRVSSTYQNEERQLIALCGLNIPENQIYTDKQSGKDFDRPAYDEESITSRFEGYMHDIMREYSMMADMKGCANIVYCDDWKSIQHDDGMGWGIFIKMELLTALPKGIGKTTTDEQVIKIGIDICSALAFCEKRNLIHRDIKLQNIFVAPDGMYKRKRQTDLETGLALASPQTNAVETVFSLHPPCTKAERCAERGRTPSSDHALPA